MKPLSAFLCILLLSACAPATPPPQKTVVTIYATSAAGPWLSKAFTCAGPQGIVLNVVAGPGDARLVLRIGEPPALTTPSFQIDTEEILVVTNRQSPVQNLTLPQARDLFAGRGDPSVQVWVYSAGEDIQQAFDRLVMMGQGITPLARLAAAPQEMSDTLNAQVNAVGILPRHWKAGTVRDVFSAGTVPVLAIVPSEPDALLRALIACLQK